MGVCTNKKIINTTNGGINWTPQTSPSLNPLESVFFVSENEGWAVGLDTTIIHTIDGGLNWDKQLITDPNLSNNHAFTSVYFTDEDYGWIVGVYGSFVMTTDGGNNWIEGESGTNNSLTCVRFIDRNNGWAVGENGTIIQTTNGGQTWLHHLPKTNLYLESIHMINSAKGWAVGENGTILHTTDGGIIINVEDENSSLPVNYSLSQNYPNPFNPSTTIKWQQPETGFVTLIIYDVLGREVAKLVSEELTSGKHETVFDASRFSSGIYFYQLKAGNYIDTKKMVLVK